MNKIFLSSLLKTNLDYSNALGNLTAKCKDYGIELNYLEGTLDVWARDYMPIQVSHSKWVQYVYLPNYLLNRVDRKTISDPSYVLQKSNLNLDITHTNILIDGGNVILAKDHLIMTEKVMAENSGRYAGDELKAELKRLFDVDHVVLIPHNKRDPFGHADGMVRFVDDRTVMVNHWIKRNSKSRSNIELHKVLDDAGLTVRHLNIGLSENSDLDWAYLNFLKTDKLILVPQLELKTDTHALDSIRDYYEPLGFVVDGVSVCDLVQKGGGGLNCVSWEIADHTPKT